MSPARREHPRQEGRLRPLPVALLLGVSYVAFCSAYILLSSARAARLASSVVELERFEQWKGVAFVAITGLLFFAAAWLVLRRLAAQQEQLERQQAVLAAAEGPALAGAFSAAVAHDINNVLTIARGGFDALARPELPPERRARAEGLIAQAFQDLADIARRMARLGATATEPHAEPLDLAQLVRDTVRFGRRHARIAGCHVGVETPASFPFRADRQLVQRALLNLLLNAAEATQGRGAIEVRLLPEGDDATLEVHDDGPGVAPELRESIFVAFQTTKPHGTGLGLFSVRSAAEAHAGHVTLETSPLGGACFRVTLSRPSGPPAPEPARSGEAAIPPHA